MVRTLGRMLVTYACVSLITPLASYGHAASENNIHSAAENGNVDAVRAIMSTGKDLNLRDQRGRTPLIAAASKGQVLVMELLMQNGADLNLQDNTGATALHQATSGGYAPAVSLLLGRGADRTLRTQSGLTAQDIAQTSHSPELISQFQQGQAGQPAYQSGVDQAQTWRTAANAAVADPCQVVAAIARDGLKEGVDTLVRLGQAERRAWAIRNQPQRARLCSMVEQQVKQEFRFIEDVARSEATGRTASDANSMQLLWGRRLQFVTDRIREVRRQEMAQAAGRPGAAPRPTPALRAGSPALQTQAPAPQPLGLTQDANVAADYFAPSSTRADQEQLATAWAASGTDTNADQILTDFNDLLIKDLGYLRTSAVTARATPKVLAAVDAVILIRSQRHALVRSDLQALAGASTGALGAVGQGQLPGQQTGRRGGVVQPGQGTGSGYNRGPRRGRMQQGN